MKYEYLYNLPQLIWASIRWICRSEKLDSDNETIQRNKEKFTTIKWILARENLDTIEPCQAKRTSFLKWLFSTETLDVLSENGHAGEKKHFLRTIFAGEQLDKAEPFQSTSSSLFRWLFSREMLNELNVTEQDEKNKIRH